MKPVLFLLVLSFIPALVIPFCKETPSSHETGVDRAHPSIEMVDYASARVFDNGRVTRSRNDVDHLGIGIVYGLTYVQQLDLQPVIVKSGASYVLQFDTVIAVPDTLITAKVRFRLYL